MESKPLNIPHIDEIYKILIDGINSVIYTLDKQGNFISVSPAIHRITRFSQADLIGSSLLRLIHSDDKARFEVFFDKILSKEFTEKRESGEFRIIDEDGAIHDVLLSNYSVVIDGDLRSVGIMALLKGTESDEWIRKLSSVIEQSPVSIVIFDIEGLIDYVNPGFSRMTGYSQEEIIGKDGRYLKSTNHDEPFYTDLWARVRSGREWSGEFNNTKKNGVSYWESATISPIRDRNGEITHFLKVGEDVTEQKHMLDVVVSSYEFIEKVMDNTNPIFVIDKEGLFIMVNRGFPEMTGYSISEVIGKHISMLFSEAIYQKIISLVDVVLTDREQVTHFETEMVKNVGGTCIISMNLSPLVRENDVAGIVGTLEDITNRKSVEDKLRQLSRAVEQSPASVVISDTHGFIEYVNPKFSSLTGYTLEEAIGQNSRILKSGEQSPDFYKEMWETVAAGREWRGEFHNKKKNGELYWEFASISPIRNNRGEITHYLAVKEDITERKKAEEALRISEENLRKKNQAMERELNYAQIIIKELLPSKTPEYRYLKMEYRYMSLEAIGGDFFSFTELHENGLGVFLGDVSGHGVSAALFLSLVKSATEKIGMEYGRHPAEYLLALNRELSTRMSSYFLTAVYGFFYCTDEVKQFTFAKGGHPPPILYRASKNSIEFLASKGRLIGMFGEDDMDIEEVAVNLQPGDRVFLYTDGINETVNEKKQMLETDGLLNIIQNNVLMDLSDSLDSIIDEVNSFRGSAPDEDDIVLVGFEVV
ncbi:MAG: PAS domain S-box protein [bacterium]|nr:PAS domain S-box protein [bacterium]